MENNMENDMGNNIEKEYNKPFFLDDTLVNGYKFIFNFQELFDKADHVDSNEIKKTFNDIFSKNKKDIKVLTELACVTNLRCWYWYERHNSEYCQLYEDLYYTIVDYVYEEGRFSESEISYYFNITD